MMKESGNLNSKVQEEALINELKGNLFEYLVGSSLAQHFCIEKEFVCSFSGRIKRQLSNYELQLREKDPHLIKQLPLLAQRTANYLVASLPKNASQLYVVGKIAGGGGNREFNEADLLMKVGEKEFSIGLKLSKSSAFVNTKSGGVKSFLQKYFCHNKDSENWQLRLNSVLERSYLQMSYELHDIADIKFNGKFDDRWIEKGFSELPGQLSKEMNKVVINCYSSVIAEIHKAFVYFYNENPIVFLESLVPLLGIGNKNIIQAICFYRDKLGVDGQRHRYNFEGLHVFDYALLKEEMKGVEIMPLKSNISSFEVCFGKMILQIRVKPMNKFTTPAFKVNCSVKRIGQ